MKVFSHSFPWVSMFQAASGACPHLEVLGSQSSGSQASDPSRYQASSASEKLNLIWNRVRDDRAKTGTWPGPLTFLEFTFEDFIPTTTFESDELPPGHVKAIHSVGVVAKARFVADPASPFGGDFKGNEHVLLRLSNAKKPSEAESAPGMGIKFLRDGRPSANFVAMFSTDGQKSGNFFENTFSNHIPPPSFLLSVVLRGFKKASDHVDKVGLSGIADGGRFPAQVWLKPPSELKESFQSMRGNEPLQEAFAELGVGTVLYHMYGSESDGSSPVYIGHFELASNLIQSKYGDEVLFFQHQRYEDDLAEVEEL